jgi:molybdopterin converting factor small subunit
MPTVFIPSLLRSYTGDRSKVEVEGRTLRQVFENLERECPGIGARIVEDGRIRPEISVAVDNELVDTGLIFPVSETSEVSLLPAISGGARYA